MTASLKILDREPGVPSPSARDHRQPAAGESSEAGTFDHQPVGAWGEYAACRGMDPDAFFPGRGDSRGLARAKAICATCPVAGECLAHADRNRERAGVWGGLSERERRRLRGWGVPS